MLGASPLFAVDGAAAWKLCEEQLPDLLVLDYMMPGLNGSEVCRKVRETEGGRLIPVLMVTAQEGLKGRVSALDEGVDDYLTKPFYLEELRARIKALLRIRLLTVELERKNEDLQSLQQRLIEKERQQVVQRLAGTAAHQLGQPLSALMLHLHVLHENRLTDDERSEILTAMHNDLRRMADIIKKLTIVKPEAASVYYEDISILDLDDE